MKSAEEYIDLANEEAAKSEGFKSFEAAKIAFSKSETKFNELDRVWNRQCGRALRIAVDTILADLQPKGKTKEEVWEEAESYHQIEGLVGAGSRFESAIYDAMESYANQQPEGMIWLAFDSDLPETYPTNYDKYLICRKDGKIHWETWNGSGWAYNHNEVRYYSEITPPQK